MAKPDLAPVFILAPPLGQGALLAACLGRHPGFAMLPATQLMCADTPYALAARWGSRMQGHDHGLIRALAALVFGGETDASAAQAADWLTEHATMPAKAVMDRLAAAAAPRRLIDASFLYAVDDSAMDRIADGFPHARFIHLLRHPATCFAAPDLARARSDSLWLRPHLRIHAFLAERDPLCWVRLRAEWLAQDPAPKLAELLKWLGAPRGKTVVARLLDAGLPADYAAKGPERAPHGLDPALASDPGLAALYGAAKAPELDEHGWTNAGFDDETRAMARLFGYA